MSKPIDILLVVAAYHDILKSGLSLGPKELQLRQTQSLVGFFWQGKQRQYWSAKSLARLGFWSLEKAPVTNPPLSPAEKLVVENFTLNHQRAKDGR